jgi:hypothetical protein
MSKDYEDLMDSLTNTPYLDTPLEYFKILDDDVEAGSLRQQLAGGGTVRQNFAEKGAAKIEFETPLELPTKKGSVLLNPKGTLYTVTVYPDEGERIVKTFGIKEYGNLKEAKTAANAFLESNKFVDSAAARKGDVVRSFLNHLSNVGEFDGEEKMGPVLEKYRSSHPDHVFEQINTDFRNWQKGKFEVEGIDRNKIPKEYKNMIDNWSPQSVGPRSAVRSLQLNYLDKLNNNTELSVDQAKKEFNKEFRNRPYWSLNTFDQRVNQLTRLKNEGKIPSNADGTKFKDYGVTKGERSPWLKQAMGQQFGGNYERFIKAGDVLTKEGKVKDAQRVYSAAEKFFGSDGIFTKLPGNAEHPLSTSYGGTDNLLKVDSLVEGDLNQFKKVVFDTPLKRLVTEYNSPNVSPARQEEIKAIANSRKNFLNYLTSGSIEKGIVSPVEFKFGDTFEVISTAKPIDKFPKNYDFGTFVTKGQGYTEAFKKFGSDFDLTTKEGFITRKGISDSRILDNLKYLKEELKVPKGEQQMIAQALADLEKVSGVKLKSFSGMDEDTLKALRKGLGKVSKSLRTLAASPVGKYGLLPITALDLAINVPIAAIDVYKGVPLKEIAGTLTWQDLIEDYNPIRGETGKGIIIPGTTERSWFEQSGFKDALPLYDLQNSYENLRSGAEGLAKIDPRKAELYPEVYKKQKQMFEKQKEEYQKEYDKLFNRPEEEVFKIGAAHEEALKARQAELDKPYFNNTETKPMTYNAFGVTVPVDEITKNVRLDFKVGGRVGFANGFDPIRRKFLKLMGAVAATPFVAPLLKKEKTVGTAVKSVLRGSGKNIPKFFPQLVEDIYKFGKVVPELARENLEQVRVYKKGDIEYTAYQDVQGNIQIDVDGPGIGAYDDKVTLAYKPEKIIDQSPEGKPIYQDEEFVVLESRPTGVRNGPDDYDIDLTETDVSVDASISNIAKIEENVTGLPADPIKQIQLQRRRAAEEADPNEFITERYGEYDDSMRDDIIDE